MGRSKICVSTNSLAQPPRSVVISGPQPGNGFSKGNLELLSFTVVISAGIFKDLTIMKRDKVEFTQHMRNPEKKAVSYHLTDHSIHNVKNSLLLTTNFYQAGSFGCCV